MKKALVEYLLGKYSSIILQGDHRLLHVLPQRQVIIQNFNSKYFPLWIVAAAGEGGSWITDRWCLLCPRKYKKIQIQKIIDKNTFLCELSAGACERGRGSWITDRWCLIWRRKYKNTKKQIQKNIDKNTFFCELSAAACARGGGSWLTDRWCLLWPRKYFPATLTRTHLANFSFVKSLSYQVIKIRSLQVLLLKV